MLTRSFLFCERNDDDDGDIMRKIHIKRPLYMKEIEMLLPITHAYIRISHVLFFLCIVPLFTQADGFK